MSEELLSIDNQNSRRPGFSFSAVFTKDRILWIGSPILILLIWEAIARSGLVTPIVLPAPSIIFETLFKLLVSGELLPHIGISLFRALTGFAVGSILGILLGLLMGWSKWINDAADIPFNILRAIPTAALVPVTIVWFGIGEFPKILLTTLPSFTMCTINTLAGVRGVDNIMIKAARSLGARDRDILKEVIIPAAMPMIFAALRLGVAVSLVVLVVIEMTAAETGLGTFIIECQRLFYTAKMFAGIITLAVLGYLLDRIVRLVEARILHWHKSKGVTAG